MSVKDNTTEELIKNTAKRIFFKEGRFNATTQEIADAAGVNRTLVHYYFRSKDVLLKKVLDDGRAEFHKKIVEIDHPELSFKEKVTHLINIWMDQGIQFPYLDSYLVSRLNDPQEIQCLIEARNPDNDKINEFLQEIKEEMNAGRIIKMDPLQFLLNLSSLISYPIVMRPLLAPAFGLNATEFDLILAQRKEIVLKTLFRD